jgi:hypothetical protein
VLVLKELQESAPALALSVRALEVRAPDEFGSAFAAMTRERDHALFVAAGVLTLEHQNRKALVALATRSRIPAMWGHRQFVEAGGLMSYAVNFYDQLRGAVIYVDKGPSRATCLWSSRQVTNWSSTSRREGAGPHDPQPPGRPPGPRRAGAPSNQSQRRVEK